MQKVIKLTGRIDTNNCLEVEKKIRKELNGNKCEIVFDANDLKYISSAGLRMILKFKKENDNTKIINCSLEVYEVFEMTGFSEMMEISKSYREISLKGCKKIGEGFYGTVYRVDAETIVKVYTKPDCLDLIKREKKLSREAFILGIPTAIAYDTVKVGKYYGAVFELLNCKSLDELIKEGADIKKLAKECVSILKKIHSTKVPDGKFPSKKKQIIERTNACKDYLSKKTFDKVIKFLENTSNENKVVHGDFHIKNLMKQDDEIIIIDMGTLSIGDPIFEFGAMYATYIAFSSVNKKNAETFLGITLEQSEEIWNTIFNEYYKNKSKEEKNNILLKSQLIAYLAVLYIRSHYNDKSNKYQKQEIEFAKNFIEENIDKVVKS